MNQCVSVILEEPVALIPSELTTLQLIPQFKCTSFKIPKACLFLVFSVTKPGFTLQLFVQAPCGRVPS